VNGSSASSVGIFSHRWQVRTLALLHDLNGARFVVLKHRLGISGESLRLCLADLMACGWVQRNEGYGHPLRPEYLLTAQSRSLAQQCSRFQRAVGRLAVAETVYRKWSVPSLLAIDAGISRFNALRDELAVTPRALTQALDRLHGADLIRHDDGYAVSQRGTIIAGLARGLCSARPG